MGACVSFYHSPTATTTTTNAKARAAESFRRPATIMVMDMKGEIREFIHPIPASHVIADNLSCFLCNSESLFIGKCIPRVPDEEQLLPGKIYFLVPLSQSHNPLSLTRLCDLVVKASSALANKTNTNSLQTSSL
ncbi:hypothetical protein TanjilG_22787 [Lupinus angustifolius]|uniref:Uncharacterized protein n=1 Tax=Lupinus angustifolius TaxID=3871 RepID=A0A4P1RI47_LUPAN|nr:hypothetical protein TanjilG_22787 [Lupinus angustifolius]